MLDWFLSMLRDTDTMRNETSSLPRVMTFWRGMNDSVLLSSSLLERVTVPTYFLWGDADPFGGADTARGFAAHFPDHELEVMPGAGHAVWMDDADHAAGVTRRFLAA
jgi:pimeloyl-ACP methyl ester carboxylesterase